MFPTAVPIWVLAAIPSVFASFAMPRSPSCRMQEALPNIFVDRCSENNATGTAGQGWTKRSTWP